MKLKKYSRKCRALVLFVLSVMSFLFPFTENLISDAITCISIIFAFSQSFLLAAYSNKDINVYMKKHGMFECFIKDNKKFLKSSLFALIALFFLIIFDFNFCFDCGCCVYVSSMHVALLIIVYQLNCTLDFADNYMNVYKNSYSLKLSREMENDRMAKI